MKPFTDKDRLLLQSCPHPGDGVHAWIFRVLCRLARLTISDRELFAVARRRITHYATRPVPDHEIQSQIPNARRYASGQAGMSSCGWKSSISTHRSPHRSPDWLPVDLVSIERIVRAGPSLAELRRRSPIPVDHGGFVTSTMLEVLFPGDPLLCCGWNKYTFKTMPRSEWANLGGMQFIVPSPMSKVQGLTQKDTMSDRSSDNTGPRRYLVIECDFKPVSMDKPGGAAQHVHDGKARLVTRLMAAGFTDLDMCSALLWHLSLRRKLALVVHSGGKSLHGWFRCDGESDERLEGFMKYAVQLGADKTTWSRCQQVRMPEGTRTGAPHHGVRQAVQYFNPSSISVHR